MNLDLVVRLQEAQDGLPSMSQRDLFRPLEMKEGSSGDG